MTLHSPGLELSIRELVRGAIRASPILRKERRRTRTAPRLAAEAASRLVATAWLFLLILKSRESGVSVAAQYGIVTLWATIMVFWQAGNLISKLYHSDDLYPLVGLPASGALIFRWQFQKFLLAGLWLLADFLAAYAALLSWTNAGVGAGLAAIIAAVVQAAFVIALAVLLVSWRPVRIYGTIAGFGFFVAFIGTLAHSIVASHFFAALESSSPWLNTLFPAGWISLFASDLLAGKADWSTLFFLPAMGVIGATLPFARRRLFRTYAILDAPAPDPEDDEEQLHETLPSDQPGPGPTEVLDAIRSRTFLEEPPAAKFGPLERLFYRWLTPRERRLAGMMVEKELNWSKRLKRGLILLAAGITIVRLWQQGAHPIGLEAWWGYLVVGVITGLLVLPLWSGLGGGFRSLVLSGTHIPLYSGYPVGYFEIARVMLKSAAIRSLGGAPVMAIGGAAGFSWLDLDPVFGAWLGLKIAWLALATCPAAVALQFSSGTNDTRRWTLTSLVLLAILIPAGLAFAGLGILLIVLPDERVWLCAALLCIPSWGFFLFYGRVFNRDRFDLMHLPA